MKTLFLCVLLMLSSCALFVDMSPKTRHQEWLMDMQQQVGRSVFDCKGDGRCLRYRGENSLFQGDSVLINGNKEAAYFMPYRKHPKCRYFFEYEPATSLIVGFRFVESEQFACAVIW